MGERLFDVYEIWAATTGGWDDDGDLGDNLVWSFGGCLGSSLSN